MLNLTLPKPPPGSRLQNKCQIDTVDAQICTDAAWKAETKDAGFGWIIKSHLLAADLHNQSSARSIRSPLTAEALAMSLALQQAKDLGFTSLSIASDSQQLIKAINLGTPSTELHGILHTL